MMSIVAEELVCVCVVSAVVVVVAVRELII